MKGDQRDVTPGREGLARRRTIGFPGDDALVLTYRAHSGLLGTTANWYVICSSLIGKPVFFSKSART